MYSNVLYILNIAVSEKYRNCGVGSLLIRKCVEMCEKEDLCAGVGILARRIESFVGVSLCIINQYDWN